MVYHTSDKNLYDLTVRTEDTVSDEVLVKMWISWSALYATFGLVSFVVWISICLVPKVRSSPFNQYLLFLMFPDWFYTFSCAITCAMNASHGSYWSFVMCQWQSWYCMWGIGTNAWLNAVLAYEVHTMLLSSYRCQRYQPPTTRTVVIRSGIVYLANAITSSLCIMEVPFYPLDTILNTGITCFPNAFGKRQMIILWLVAMPMFVMLPYVYVMYACFDIWLKQLMPPRGKRRLLTIYFFRIVAVFLFMWGPVAFFNFLFKNFVSNASWELAGLYIVSILAHFQAFVSAVVAMTKPDIGACVMSLLTKICIKLCYCCCCKTTPTDFSFVSSLGFRAPSIWRASQQQKPATQNNNNSHEIDHGHQPREEVPGHQSSLWVTGFSQQGVEDSLATYESVMESWKDIPGQTADFQFEDEKEEEAQDEENVQRKEDPTNKHVDCNDSKQPAHEAPVPVSGDEKF